MARSRTWRRHHRKAPAVRRSGGDLIVGGTKDPAEHAANRVASNALAGGAKKQRAHYGDLKGIHWLNELYEMVAGWDTTAAKPIPAPTGNSRTPG